MNIAIDYDNTYDRDPVLWSWFSVDARHNDHSVWVVTQNYRKDRPDIVEELAPLVWIEGIVFCGDSSKKAFMEHKGIHIDVWIDDDPGTIIGVY